ncbi:YezD family protein [Seleniivibrio woodruffii]|uniref:YezD family protein n=1 Tax=Seleniivibrio woodruffii TaxID=1078050 RepID=UPI00240A714E|nr:YezD family protein [Seleniivibrio woodruffii]
MTANRLQRPTAWNSDIERLVKELVSSVMFGTVTIIIQDGRIIQVDRNEKIRISKSVHQDGSGI